MTVVEPAHWEAHFASGRGFRPVDAQEADLLAEAVRPGPGTRALDVGCGLGGYAAALARLGCRTWAVDRAASAVAAVRDRYTDLEPSLTVGLLDFNDGAAVSARLPRASFDLVTMRLVVAFLPDLPAVAARVRGLLSPGGAWVVTTPLTGRLPAGRTGIGLAPDDVAALTDGWPRGHWYDLQGGLRCFVLSDAGPVPGRT
ncbi:class I SAM-dependent methyltransferase [Streptomyces poriticola]|uniref:class I SAM-dependent methyltransferase n=1 Tax=Streptomyces poriticola TaxID=3120506 RepID=UPI002FCE12FF